MADFTLRQPQQIVLGHMPSASRVVVANQPTTLIADFKMGAAILEALDHPHRLTPRLFHHRRWA
ncbi:hypothetical protein D3C84_517770 [compost metagenome]